MSTPVLFQSGFVIALLVMFLSGCSGAGVTIGNDSRPLPRNAPASWYRCGAREVQVRYNPDSVVLTFDGREETLQRVRSASGARYELQESGAPMEFWDKGTAATLEADGQTFPECERITLPGVPVPFVGRGNEPFWSVQITRDALTVTRDLGSNVVTVPGFSVQRTDVGVRVTTFGSGGPGSDEPLPVAVDITGMLCHDSMSGMVFPYTVAVMTERENLQGCGGESLSLLQGHEWLVEDIDRKGIVDSSRVSLVFDGEGRFAGRSSCNRYTGSYQLTGEGLSFDGIAITRMACPPALMNQEALFLRILGDVVRFDIAADAALLLITADERVILARHDDV